MSVTLTPSFFPAAFTAAARFVVSSMALTPCCVNLMVVIKVAIENLLSREWAIWAKIALFRPGQLTLRPLGFQRILTSHEGTRRTVQPFSRTAAYSSLPHGRGIRSWVSAAYPLRSYPERIQNHAFNSGPVHPP